MKKVKTEISHNGIVSIEFIGYVGDECSQERERLKNVLIDLGVMLDLEKVIKKSVEQISSETITTNRERNKVTL